MIISIYQTKANIKHEYKIDLDNMTYNASTGGISSLQDITMVAEGDEFRAKWLPASPLSYLPFLSWFGHEQKTRAAAIEQNGKDIAEIYLSKHGFMKAYYVIKPKHGAVLHGYDISRGRFNYVCIFEGDVQIALLETYMAMGENKCLHKLYILDSHSDCRRLLSLFGIYHSNYRFAQKGFSFYGTSIRVERSFSKYNGKYDPHWREEHFPNENFFGKINLFD